MDILGQLLVIGISNGAIYAIVALCLVLFYNVTRALNLVQGEFMFLGGFLTFSLLIRLPMAAAVIVAIILTIIIAILFEKMFYSRARAGGHTILLLFGGVFLFEGIMMVIWGKMPSSLPIFSQRLFISFLGIPIATQSLWIIGVTTVSLFLFWFFFTRTIFGKAMRATSQNPTAAKLVGINTGTMVSLAFALTGGIGALSGITIAPVISLMYDSGLYFMVLGCMAAVLGGGLRSYIGAVVGGLVIGIVDSLTIGYISTLYSGAIVFALLLLILLVRPAGLIKGEA